MVNFKTLALIPALLAAAAPTTDPTPSTTYVGEVVWPLRGQPLRLNMTYPLVWDITSEDIETGTPGRICLIPVYGNHQTCDGSNLLVEKVDMNASGGANYPGVTIPETATLGPAYLSVNNGGDFGDGNLVIETEKVFIMRDKWL